MGFAATPETDADTASLESHLTGTFAITPQGEAGALGLQVNIGTSIQQVYDCTATLTEMVAN